MEIIKGIIEIIVRVIRVGVMNNFNASPAEYRQLRELTKSTDRAFVNMNAETLSDPETRKRVINEGIPAVVTFNPNLYHSESQYREFAAWIDEIRSVVKFVRFKFAVLLTDEMEIAARFIPSGIPVVYTMYRATSAKLADDLKMDSRHYEWRDSFHRHMPSVQKIADEFAAKHITGNPVYTCDKSGNGCQSCGLCTKLTFNEPATKIHELNLSESGVCKFDCPGCFAKKQLQRTKTKRPQYNVIKRNAKMKKGEK